MPDIDEVFGPDVTVSLNIAAKQACDVPFMTAFCASLGETGLAERFVLELTEEAFFTAGRFQRDVLRGSGRSERGSRSTISASATRRCRPWRTSPLTS